MRSLLSLPSILLALVLFQMPSRGISQNSLPSGASPTESQSKVITITSSDFTTITGDSLSLSDYKGSVVLLHFFASWCGECILEAPSLEKLSRSIDDSRFIVVGVAIDDEAVAAKAFSDRLGLTFPVIIDSQSILKRRFGVRGVPMTVMLGKDGTQTSFVDPASGRNVSHVIGARDWSGAPARSTIEKILRSQSSSEGDSRLGV